ncbi:drug/metabolite transporter (DMT)-like permease [Paenibacillus forsythiae]|uniref:Drug/metabolite transporter (DMT)-like permease n=1 Tax=Paenibacillus forsythiae TaxID=365616 RepID=A0ABU3H4L4_9BACL|nr:DMT family transporter [Paenibacillus forsythiae]MDT3425769.1 drug/metabolite transporter (DMT)-like permease [Paenibacillus forsythiae]
MGKYRIYLFLILANLFWAGNYVFGKYVVAEMTPVQMTFSRWLIAVCLLFPIAHFVERPDWKSVVKEWRILLLMSVLGVVGYNFLLYEALRFTTSMNAALVNAMNPALIVLFSSLFLREKISLAKGVGLLVSLLGVLLVLTKGQLQLIFQTEYNLGDLLMLAAILVWTFYSILGRKMKGLPPISATAISALMGLLLILPFFLASGIQLPLSPKATMGILYIGIFPSVGSFIFWNASIREIGASRAGIYLNLITVFTAILSMLLGNPVTLAQVLGGLLVFAGVYITGKKTKGPEANKPRLAK